MTNMEYDYQDVYDVTSYPHPIHITPGTLDLAFWRGWDIK